VDIRLLDSVKDDLRSGWLFYEGRLSGLGDRFLDAIDADVQLLTVSAGIHLKVDGFHRLLIRRFPFALYYLVEESSIDIYAILDCRRDPLRIRSRLQADRPIPSA
jgi:hypothetical protein